MSQLIIGLTGGIGSGKTTVSNMFAQLNVDIIDADIVARQVVEPNSPALKTIQIHFGDEYIKDDLQLDRNKLRSRIFSNPEDKLWLNNLLHPLIREEILKQLSHATSQYCIFVAPLLLENNLQTLVNHILVIDVDEATQIQRTQIRDNTHSSQVKNIISSQISRNERLKLADDIIDNQNNNREKVKAIVVKLHQKYLLMSQNNVNSL